MSNVTAPWGPLPSAAEVTAHVARCTPANPSWGALWERCDDRLGVPVVSVVRLATLGDHVMAHRGREEWSVVHDGDASAQWRAVDADGVAVERGAT